MRQDGAGWGTVSQQSTLLTHMMCCLRLLLLVCSSLSHTIKGSITEVVLMGQGGVVTDPLPCQQLQSHMVVADCSGLAELTMSWRLSTL